MDTTSPAVPFRYVAIIGVDGAGAFFKDAYTPHFDRIFKGGAVTYSMLTSFPTISAECWGSLLYGVDPEQHKFTNQKAMEGPCDPDSPYPSIFRVLQKTRGAGVRMGSFSCWPAINIGMVEDNLEVCKAVAPDPKLNEWIIEFVKEGVPDLLFVQFDHVDGAGHKNGYGTQAHLDAITAADELYGQIHAAYAEAGVLDETLFIVVSDHGGTPDRSHGGDTDAEKYITFAAAGKGVKPCSFEGARIKDVAAIAAYALGCRIPENWSGKVPEGLF